VIFLLFLYPATHHYNTLDVVKKNIHELDLNSNPEAQLKDHITILNFVGADPLSKSTAALNLKELIYDKFLGFKGFQIVTLAPTGSEQGLKELRKQLLDYDALKYWRFTTASPEAIAKVYASLKSDSSLDSNFATNHVFIIDKDLVQRGRLDDRTEAQRAKQSHINQLYSYNCIKVAEIKNKMSEDLRILFTEYRQKRKGNFDSSTRREQSIKTHEQD
jgi:hypothetical protein